MKNRLHQECYTRSCQEIEELKRRCYKEENGVTQQKMNEYSMQHDQESRTLSLLRDQIRKLTERLEFIEDSKIFQDPDSPSSFGSAHVSQQALIPSSSKKPCRESRMQRNTREDMSIPGSVFDCQPARQVPEELHDDVRNLAAASSGIQRREGIEKVGTNTFTLLFGKSEGKKSGRQKLSQVYGSPYRGYRDLCTQSGMTLPSHPSSEMHLGTFSDHTEFQKWIVNFRTEVCSKATNPAKEPVRAHSTALR